MSLALALVLRGEVARLTGTRETQAMPLKE